MKKTIFSIPLILIFIFCFGNAYSQEETDKPPKCTNTTNLNHYIKFSPMSLLEIESSILLGYSYPIKKGKMQLQHELGYVYLNEMFFPFNDYERTFNGFKFRNNLRVYNGSSGAKGAMKNTKRMYFAMDLMYKYSKYVEEDKNILIQEGHYIQIMDVETEKYVGALHFITGIERNLIESGGLMFDFYLGVGVRYKYLKPLYDIDIEDDNNDFGLFRSFSSEYRLFYDNEGTSILFSVMAGIKIGFGL